MVTLWDESVAVVVRMGVIYPTVSPYSLGSLLGRLAFLCLWFLGIVSGAMFLRLPFRGSGGVFTDDWAMVLTVTLSVCTFLMMVFFCFPTSPRLL